MDRKRVALAIGSVVLALIVLGFVASRNLAEPTIEANIPPGSNARTEDAPEH